MTEKYEVGYGKPPAASRFKPGQSGNPKGRKKKPKADNSLKPVLREALNQPITVGDKKLTPQQIMVMNLLNQAMKGDLRAIKAVFELEEKLGINEPEVRGGVLKITRVPPELREQWAKIQQAKFRGDDPEGLAALDAGLPPGEQGRM